jgi:hypothetical protein
MVAVPALIALDQLISYVRISPGKNASMFDGGAAIRRLSGMATTGTSDMPRIRTQRAVDFKRAG